MNLNLHDIPASGSGFIRGITHLAEGWRRSKLAVGGYHIGTFSITSGGISDLTDFYNMWIGHRITETTAGMITWEGVIWQTDLIKDGITHRRTLSPEQWHNRIKVLYSDDVGERSSIAWSENTDSSDIYGEMEYVISLGGATSAGATALQARHLTDFAWPRSRIVDSITIGQAGGRQNGLYITAVGFWATLNWQYRETSETAAASTLLGTLIGETEFVTAGRVETNSLSVRVDAFPIPQRIGDLVEDIIRQGDASGNVWQGGVYADQKFVYESAPTAVDYYIERGRMYNKAGTLITPELLDPGFFVRNVNAPMSWEPPGTSNVWDDPTVAYCDQVEYIHPGIIKLHFPGESSRVEILQQRITKGNV